ncbi:LUD domain-containing protein [Streptomyces sp. TRM 70351]|uniref:LutC/YkgG family protein n=1 Tax=Streptomyces sp. TRM 70351 TaxID=3116552 RepID=UPI002E7B27BA|nr:LUD domain-containing protein [Streptomyces sp. TRM 70351]MEE1927157.1 LUD domain-containing protein [Streptomyces sp. TRM 70351]
MSGGRDVVLARVRRALSGVPDAPPPYERAVRRGYLREHGALGPEQAVELLAGNLADYRARVHRCTDAGLTATVAGLLEERGARTVLVPPGLPGGWVPAGVTLLRDEAHSTPRDLEEADSVVTGCAVAIAETGTLVLDGSPDQGRRRITLVPDHHVCVVRVPGQVVSSVPRALERLVVTRPLTWISGPSATSDIELERVEGVHGPRTLDVVLLGEPGGGDDAGRDAAGRR